MAAGAAYFTPATFDFLRALARNNRRAWFAAHRDEYERHVRTPFLRLIADLAAPLRALSPHYVADPRPMGGSLFRIHRDTRFSGDKAPYKTHAGARFFHAWTQAHSRSAAGNAAPGRLDAPVFYLHVEPGASFVGAGLWHPQPQTLARVRNYLVNNPASWKQATRRAAFRRVYGELGGATLRRAPRGHDPVHELIEDLKRKDFVCAAPLSDAQLCRPDLPQLVLRRLRTAAPLVDWLCGALDLEF
jgi:uncharacterized protein (TIGR02453 family)